jgi:hypothetical protein
LQLNRIKSILLSRIIKFYQKSSNLLISVSKIDRPQNVQTFSGSLISVAKSEIDLSESSCAKNCFTLSINILKEMGNMSLLKENLAFLLITLSGFFVFAGYFAPFLFIPRRAQELKINEYAWLLSIIGYFLDQN